MDEKPRTVEVGGHEFTQEQLEALVDSKKKSVLEKSPNSPNDIDDLMGYLVNQQIPDYMKAEVAAFLKELIADGGYELPMGEGHPAWNVSEKVTRMLGQYEEAGKQEVPA